jgi:hypothetical protein
VQRFIAAGRTCRRADVNQKINLRPSALTHLPFQHRKQLRPALCRHALLENADVL